MKTPAADRKFLVLLAGLVWSAVGLILCITGCGWLAHVHSVLVPVGVGIAGGLIVCHFGFSRLVDGNLVRIFETSPQKNKICLFAFQNTRSYIIVAIMMFLGFILRHLPIPKSYLAPMYMTVGIGLFLASLKYYVRLGRELS